MKESKEIRRKLEVAWRSCTDFVIGTTSASSSSQETHGDYRKGECNRKVLFRGFGNDVGDRCGGYPGDYRRVI